MKIQLDIDEEYEEALVIIKSKEMTEEISEILKKLKSIKKRNVIGLEDELRGESFVRISKFAIVFSYSNVCWLGTIRI